MVFRACDIPKFFDNTKQLLEAETKLIYIVQLTLIVLMWRIG